MALRARMTTPEDMAAGYYTADYTQLNAIATCPTHGLVRYTHSKTFDASERAMALEAGSVVHECVAAMSVLQLRHQGLNDHANVVMKREFSTLDRHLEIFKPLDRRESIVHHLQQTVERTIATSNFYDDPDDPKRSISVIENTVREYVNRMPWTKEPIWVADEADPTKPIGVEMNVDMIVEYDPALPPIRYIGRADRLQWTNEDKQAIRIVDIKTTSMNMEASWEAGFTLSYQFTGYAVFAALLTGHPVWHCGVHGLRLPIPVRSPMNGIRIIKFDRGEHHIEQWRQWIGFCVATKNMYVDEAWNAPKFTHSCNRFFRPCPLLPLCDQSAADAEQIFNEMEVKEWNPISAIQSE
jgi:hypothetical protein